MICHAGLDEGGEPGMPAAEMFAKKGFFGFCDYEEEEDEGDDQQEGTTESKKSATEAAATAAAAAEENFLASFGRDRPLVEPDQDTVVFFKPLVGEGEGKEQFNHVAREQAETIAKLAADLAVMDAGCGSAAEEVETTESGEGEGVVTANDSSYVLVEAEGSSGNGIDFNS